MIVHRRSRNLLSQLFQSALNSRSLLALTLAALFVAGNCVAQEAASPLSSVPSGQAGNQAALKPSHVTIPAGTNIPLVLTRYINSKDVRSGDAVFAQVSNPVLVGDQVAIPAGTFVRGKVDKLTRSGTRGELLMSSAGLVMGINIVDLGGPVNIESEEWTAENNPGGKSKAAIILVPMLALPLGAVIGSAADGKTTKNLNGIPVTTQSHTGLVTGTAVGFGAGLATTFALMAHSHQFYLGEGSPLHMTLARAVALSSEQIADAQRNVAPVQIVRRTRSWPGNDPLGTPGGTPSIGPGSCSAGQEWCAGSCKSTIDFISDDHNCGSCGRSCSFGESCTGGSCSCAAGYSSCMGQCVSSSSFISDNNNCGSCGHSCSFGESCMGGSCTRTN
jgi:hypothetical protein